MANKIKNLAFSNIISFIKSFKTNSPEEFMNQSVKQIDEHITTAKNELGKILALEHNIKKQISSSDLRHQKLSKQINLNLSQGSYDLAKISISDQLKVENQTPILNNKILDLKEHKKELELYITSMNLKKDKIKDEVTNYLESNKDSFNIFSNIKEIQKKLEKYNTLQNTNDFDEEFENKISELEKYTHNDLVEQRLLEIKSNKEDK